MAQPTLANAYPSAGPTSGGTLVRLLGLAFADRVRVYFGDTEAELVQVASKGKVYARSPISTFAAPVTGTGDGTVDIRLVNLDANGDEVPGEESTLADAFRYVQPEFLTMNQLDMVQRALIEELRRQVVSNTLISQHTDYDSETGDGRNLVDVAKLPALVLLGPETPENREYSLNGRVTAVDSDGTVVEREAPLTVDVVFDFVGMADNLKSMTGLHQAMLRFVAKNRWLRVRSNPEDPTSEVIRYEMDIQLGNYPRVTGIASESNVRNFTGTLTIRGVDIEVDAGFANGPLGVDAVRRTAPLSEGVTLTVDAMIGDTYDVGPSEPNETVRDGFAPWDE